MNPSLAPGGPDAAHLPHRFPLRLREFDYSSPGAYFITICTFRRACLLGDVDGDHVTLSAVGAMVAATWFGLPRYYPAVQTDAFVVMPNHIHGVLFLHGEQPAIPPPTDGQAWKPAPTAGLPAVIHGFKSMTTHQFSWPEQDPVHGTLRHPLWQRNYYEHVVRDESSLLRIREYIADNPLSWALDRENPTATKVAGEPATHDPWLA